MMTDTRSLGCPDVQDREQEVGGNEDFGSRSYDVRAGADPFEYLLNHSDIL